MKQPTKSVLFLLGFLLIFAGCQEDPVLSPNIADNDPGTNSGLITDNYTDFTLKFDDADGPFGTLQGPFFLKGTNLRYDHQIGALAVDFTITNSGLFPHPEPVQVSFRNFIPDSVSVLNYPDDSGVFTFGFANDDGVWTPGEESFPLTVLFKVPHGVSIGFTARITLGYGIQSGAIMGRVWNDLNGDGVMDSDEPGQPGVQVVLEGDLLWFEKTEIETRMTLSGPNGEFAFGLLKPGHYVVGILPLPGMEMTTTAMSLHILLVENDGGVSNFEGANFGVQMLVSPYITIPADADATIRADLSSRVNDNYGADPFLIVGGSRTADPDVPADAMRSLIHFPLERISRPVAEARLEMTIADFWEGVDETYFVEVYPVVPSGDRTPWIEGNGCETLPILSGVEWVDPAFGVAWIGAADGGDLNNQTRPDIGDTSVATAQIVQNLNVPGDVISWDVTDLVNGWITGETPNHGIMLRDGNVASGFRQLMFGARDGFLRGHPDPRVQEGPRLQLIMAPIGID